MIKRVCDICGKREGDFRFRVQREIEVLKHSMFGFPIPSKEWVDIDICRTCYNKIANGDDEELRE